MKPLFIHLFSALLPLLASGQSFEKGGLSGGVGAGLGIYNTLSVDKQSNTSKNDRAAAWVFPVMAEYGIGARFGTAALFKYSNYIEGDSSKTIGVNGFDLMAVPAYHLVNRNRINMDVHGDIGVSYIQYRSNDYSNIKASGWAPVFGGGIKMSLYFTNLFAVFLDYTYYSFSYNNIKAEDNKGNTSYYKAAFGGGNVSLGLMFKIN